MIAPNTACRPRKRSRASAYPASESRKTRPSVMHDGHDEQLVSHRPDRSGVPVNEDPLEAASVAGCGIGESGLCGRVRVGLERGRRAG